MIRFQGFEASGSFHVACAHQRCNELTYQVLHRPSAPQVPATHHDRIRLAYMELLANALQASAKSGGEMITIAWQLDYGMLSLKITNEGVEFTPTARHFLMPDPYAERGRGIPLAIRLTDGLQYYHEDGMTVVHAYWDFDVPHYATVPFTVDPEAA